MQGKTCVVTGGTGGIGLVCSRALARRGAEVIIVGRDEGRGQAAAAAAAKEAGAGSLAFIRGDLSNQAGIRKLAQEITGRHDRLDVLVNNAGGMFPKRQLSADGIEMTFALNHLGYFSMSALMLPLLRAAGTARIVNVASAAHQGVALDFANLQGERRYSGWQAYKRSKLANLLFTYALARRLDGGAVSVNALHPGFVATEIGVRNRLVPGFIWRLASLAAITPEEGAQTSFYLASSADVEGINGQYFVKCAPAQSSAASHDRAAEERLWRVSEELTGLTPA